MDLSLLDSLLQQVPLSQLQKAAEELSLAYRSQSEGKQQKLYMKTWVHKLAYLALRFPSTYAAAKEVLKKLPEPANEVLDFGAGPGTMLGACLSLFPTLKSAHLIEQDAELREICKSLFPHFPQKKIEPFLAKEDKKYPLVTAAYVFSELAQEQLLPTVEMLFDACSSYFVLIEPGTPYGFSIIHQVRSYLIAKGGTILAPCTHEGSCPLWEKDFCHFSVRFNRTLFQKRVKSADLGYEDEKYSYLIVSKKALPRSSCRVIKTPMQRSGHVRLTLCSEKGAQEVVISKKQGALYQTAKRLDWGSEFS